MLLISSACDELKFTWEMEENDTLSSLDLNIRRDSNGTINLSIFGKPTNTQRFLPVESNHHPQHEFTAFNSMLHR